MESIFIAEAAIHKQKIMKDTCNDVTPISGSSAGYREKRSHNHMTCSQWA